MNWSADRRPNVPLSPWAERYGLPLKFAEMNIFRRPDIQHSSFAPQLPSLDPLYYAEQLDQNVPSQPQSYLELDRLFLSEQAQVSLFSTIQSWQLGPVNRFISFNGRDAIPSGHMKASAGDKAAYEATFNASRIDVDEDRWFPLFRKDRWFDYAKPAEELGGRRWTVDVPEIWAHMRIALELADRMLKALILDKHPFMDTLLFGHMGVWKQMREAVPSVIPEPYPDAIVLLSREKYREVWTEARARQKAGGPPPPGDPGNVSSFALNVSTTVDPADIFPYDRVPILDVEWHNRFLLLTRNQEFCFLNDPDSSLVNGVTSVRGGGIICLNTYPLFQLMKGGMTISEQCFAYFLLARLVLHELAHAMTLARWMERGTFFTSLPPDDAELHLFQEPFVDFRGQAEMGYACEAALFGGVMRSSSFNNHISSIPLATHEETFPFPNQTANSKYLGPVHPNHPDFGPGVLIHRTMVPALFASKLMSNAFWHDPEIPRKTDNFFHRTALFYGVTPNKPGYQFNDYANEIQLDLNTFADMVLDGRSNPIWQDMVDNWRWNQSLWIERRKGWYDLERQKWKLTPWAAPSESRRMIDRFRLEFEKGADTRDLYECGAMARFLVQIIDITLSPNAYNELLQRATNLWYFHVIGLLMQAALPIRHQTTERAVPPKPPQAIEPSTEALASGAQPRNLSLTLPISRQNVLFQSFFANPYTAQGGDATPIPKAVSTIDQTDYLDLAMRVIAGMAMAQRVVSTPWLNEILRVERSLRAQRQALVKQYPDDVALRRSMCVNWDFVSPDYAPFAMCRWDMAKADWTPIST